MIRFVMEQLAYATRGAAKMFREHPETWTQGNYHHTRPIMGIVESKSYPAFSGEVPARMVDAPGWQHCAMGGIDVALGRNQHGYSTIDDWSDGYHLSLDEVIGTMLFHDLTEVGQRKGMIKPYHWDNIIYFNDSAFCGVRSGVMGTYDLCALDQHVLHVANVLDEMADGLDALYEWQSELEGYTPMVGVTVEQREEVYVRV